jgi:two-component system, NtrC family, sensor kinase
VRMPDRVYFWDVMGRKRILDLKANMLRDACDQGVGWILMINDITEAVEAQAMAAQSSKMESLGTLAAGLAHEINTPLQYMRNNLDFALETMNRLLILNEELLRWHQQDPGARHRSLEDYPDPGQLLIDMDLDYLKKELPLSLEQTMEGIHDIQSIVLALMHFTSPISSDKRLINVNSCVEQVLLILKGQLRELDELNVDLDRELIPVLMYPETFNQALFNIVNNALESTSRQRARRGGEYRPRMRISTGLDPDWIKVEIADNGTGMNAEQLIRIYDPFFSTMNVGEGKGQGLTVAHDVIFNQHQGRIDVESSPGTGAVFSIRIPRITE